MLAAGCCCCCCCCCCWKGAWTCAAVDAIDRGEEMHTHAEDASVGMARAAQTPTRCTDGTAGALIVLTRATAGLWVLNAPVQRLERCERAMFC